jgi:hypothetical protein
VDHLVILVDVVRAVHDHEIGVHRRELVVEARDERVYREIFDARLGLGIGQDEADPEVLGRTRGLGPTDRVAVRDRGDVKRDRSTAAGELGDQAAGPDLDVVGVRADRERLAYVIPLESALRTTHVAWTRRAVQRRTRASYSEVGLSRFEEK